MSAVAAGGIGPRARRVLVPLAAALLVAGVVVAVEQPPADAAARSTVLAAASRYGRTHGYRIGVAVYDTKENKVYGSGSYRSTFASESVVKAMIATRLLLQGRMHGNTARRAYKMITQSDDAIASSFYGSVGGDGLINWIKRHYHVPDLGSPPHRAYWWGNTHITPIGLVKFYAKVKKDRRVGPWLLNAMHHARRYGSDGTYQFFGLPSATSKAAIKQGWGTDYDDWGRSADFNTTGFVNGDRYAVAILARGPVRTYGSAIGGMLTHAARALLPGGRFPDAVPTFTHRSPHSGPTSGGQVVRIEGRDFTHVSKVMFGGYTGTHLRVVSSSLLYVTTPRHPAMNVRIRVYTDHGVGATTGFYEFVSRPSVTMVSPSRGSALGGSTVTVYGANFRGVSSVQVGGHPGGHVHVLSPGKLTVQVPHGWTGGPSDVLVRTYYGSSNTSVKYTYLPYAARASGGAAAVTIAGYGFGPVTGVLFNGVAGTITSKQSTSIVVTPPSQTPAGAKIALSSPYGSTSVPYAYPG